MDRTATARGLTLGLPGLALLLGLAVVPSMQAQTAPYVLPYNMTTFAGPNAQYTAGAPCSPTSSLIALDVDGDGCLATQASVNIDPHDIRVDSQGFVYIVDDGASIAVVHRINPYTGLYTIYYGSLQQTKECTTPTGAATTTGAGDGAGDGCVASDGLANSTTTYFTYYPGSNIRGLGFSPSNDLFLSDYTLDSVQKIAGAIYTSGTTFGHLATGIAGKVSAGKGSSGTANGIYGTSQLKSNRGASADAAGTVYIADSGNNLIRKVGGGTATTSGTSSTVSATNTTPTYITGSTGNNVALSSATFVGPEDAQVDVYGNLIIADFGDNLVRAVYHYAAPSTTATEPGFFGITSGLVAGNVYTIAGTGAPPKVSSTCTAATTGTANASAYANYTFTNGISNSLPGTSVPIQVRKLGLDAQGNVYIADGCDGVVYFLDAQTGGMHVIAGIYGQGQTAPTTANAPGVCAAATDFVGDGCPGTQASLDPTNMATQPDTQGNLYITDSEGGTNAALARIRKLTNGLNFSATTVGSSVTQGVLIHFAKGDVPATTNAFVVPSSDFSVLGSSCNTNSSTDNTTDCVVSLKYTPTQPGFETSTLTANSKLGGTVTYRITGIGSTPELAYDPGNTTQLNATVSGSQGAVVDGQGNAYIADTGNNQVLLYSAASGTTTTLIASSAGLKSPKAIALGTDGSLYIADTGNNLIRKYSSSGTLTTIGGGATPPAVGNICYTGSGANATDTFGDGCPATNASFNAPSGIAVDSLGNVFVADTGNKIVRVISTNGYVTQLLTNFTTSAGNSSPFAAPAGLAFDVVNSNLIVADQTNSYIYSINLNTTYPTPLATPGTIVTNPVKIVAGTGASGSNVGTNAVATSSQLNAPTGVSVDASGNIYIADTGNNAIRLVTPGGTISTIAGILGSKNGTGTIGSTAKITAYSYTTNSTTNVTTVTLTANNSFTAGTNVTFSGLTTLTFLNNQNLSVQTGPTATQFQVEYAGAISNPPPSSGSETGTASSSSLATATQLSVPGAVAVTPLGNLVIADSGNNRLLYDSRSQVSFNFGRVNLNSSSATQTFTAVNVGNSAATLNGLTTNPSSTTFTLTGCSVGTLALGSTCALTGQFNPTAAGLQTAIYSDTNGSPNYTPLLPSNPSITLIGTGAALTPTSISIVQTVPATGNPQFGAPITLQATVTAGTCNLFAPSCVPSGTVVFSIDNVAGTGVATTAGATSATASESPTGLSVGQHTITCTFTPDSTDNAYYASSSCAQPYLIVTVTQGGSMSVLSYPQGSNNQPQFTPVTLSATVTSVPASGVPTGSVTFYSDAAMQNPIGTGPVNATTGIATLPLFVTTDKNGNVIFNNTLLPGTYTLTCQYNPTPPASTSNYTSSTCPGVSFTVTGDAASLTLNPIPCAPSQIYQPGTSTPLQGLPCPSLAPSTGGLPTVATAQGATTDVTLFVTPSNTVSGTLSFSCSGLPANSVCTFSPQTLTLTAGTAYPQPIYTDVTLWTDIPPGVTPSKAEMKLPGHTGDGTQLALMLGWPLTLLGFFGLLRFRRSARSRGLTLTALVLLMAGSAMTLSGCAGPGIYHPNLTPVGTYAVTITVTGQNVSQSTVVDFTVTQGIAGQE